MWRAAFALSPGTISSLEVKETIADTDLQWAMRIELVEDELVTVQVMGQHCDLVSGIKASQQMYPMHWAPSAGLRSQD